MKKDKIIARIIELPAIVKIYIMLIVMFIFFSGMFVLLDHNTRYICDNRTIYYTYTYTCVDKDNKIPYWFENHTCVKIDSYDYMFDGEMYNKCPRIIEKTDIINNTYIDKYCVFKEEIIKNKTIE